jgi:hypothetical protein
LYIAIDVEITREFQDLFNTQTQKNMAIKMSKKHKEDYAIIMYNKTYNRLTDTEKENVLNQYAAEHCLFTRADEKLLMLQEQYGKNHVSNEHKRIYS